MRIRPIFYLNDWTEGDLGALKRIAGLGWPVLLRSEEVQTSPVGHQVLQLFQEGQVQLLSSDVDEPINPLQLVIDNCCQKGWTHVIAVNQFDPAVIKGLEQLPEKIHQHPWHFIYLVAREQSQNENSPLMQRLLDLGPTDYRNFISELCVYPVFYVQNLKFKKNDPLVHLKILQAAARAKRPLLKISLDFEVKPKKISLLQRMRQSLYDWSLVALTSLHNSTRPTHSAVSLAMGVFVGCTPFYGLQTFLILGAAMLFRLSFPVAVLGSQVSLPPLYSLIVPAQLFVGFKVTGKSFSVEGPLLRVAQDHFLSWLIGSLIVGGALSLILGGFWYWLQRKKFQADVTWTGRMRGGRLGNAVMITLIKTAGLGFAYFLLYFIVPYFYLFAPKARRGLNQYYKIIKPHLGYGKRQAAVLRHLYRFAQTLVDQAYQASKRELVFDIQYVSGEALKGEPFQGPRVMLFSHFGGWGITTQGFSRRKSLSKTINIIRYTANDLSTDKMLQEKQADNLKRINIKPGEPVFMAIHQVLGRDGDLAIMGDRPFDNHFELKPFCGKLAPIPSTPFRLGRTYKAQLNFVLGFKTGSRSYGLATDSLTMADHSVDEAMTSYASFLENFIQKYPEQWFNLYSYWSSLPTLPNGILCEPTRYEMDIPFKE